MSVAPRPPFGSRAILAWGLAAALALAAVAAQAAPKARLWQRWTAHDAQGSQTVNHGAWGRLLERYLRVGADGVNRFAYSQVSEGDKAALAGYVDMLAAQPVSRLNRREQLAYWLNLYNALTVRVVLDHYPVASIRDIDISPGLFATGPWGKKLVTVEGERLSLDDIEHRILRPIWKDPRIHYAVNCASIGCPNLMQHPFTAADAERMLDAAARAYVNHPRGASVKDGALVVSSIYHWFEEDFGGSAQGVIAHLQRFAGPDLAGELAAVADIDDHRYDWALNDAAGDAQTLR